MVPQFGDSQKLRLVRILRSTVMVRVGGGWVALDEFLVKNDPCRGKHLPPVLGLLLENVVYMVINIRGYAFTLIYILVM